MSHRTMGWGGEGTYQGPVPDILIWVECCDMMVAVLVKMFPGKGPESYQNRIVHTSCNFVGSTWVAYGTAHTCRHQALSSHRLVWTIEDPSLHNRAVVSHVKLIPRCKNCLSEHHSSMQSLHSHDTVHGPWGLAAAPQYPALQSQAFQPRVHGPSTTQQEVCRKFNVDWCFIRHCRFLHIIPTRHQSSDLIRAIEQARIGSVPQPNGKVVTHQSSALIRTIEQARIGSVPQPNGKVVTHQSSDLIRTIEQARIGSVPQPNGKIVTHQSSALIRNIEQARIGSAPQPNGKVVAHFNYSLLSC